MSTVTVDRFRLCRAHGTLDYAVCQVVPQDLNVVICANSAHCAAYGFLAGKEVKEAGVGNIGLQDREYSPHRLNLLSPRDIDSLGPRHHWQSASHFAGSRSTSQRSGEIPRR